MCNPNPQAFERQLIWPNVISASLIVQMHLGDIIYDLSMILYLRHVFTSAVMDFLMGPSFSLTNPHSISPMIPLSTREYFKINILKQEKEKRITITLFFSAN